MLISTDRGRLWMAVAISHHPVEGLKVSQLTATRWLRQSQSAITLLRD